MGLKILGMRNLQGRKKKRRANVGVVVAVEYELDNVRDNCKR